MWKSFDGHVLADEAFVKSVSDFKLGAEVPVPIGVTITVAHHKEADLQPALAKLRMRQRKH